MIRFILIAAASVMLLAAPIADAQTCQPGDPCWGQQIGGLVMITDAPAAPRKVVVKQPRRVVYQSAPVYVSAGSYGTSGAGSYGSSGTYRTTTTTVTTSGSYGTSGAYKQPVEVKTRRGLFGRRTITTYRYTK